MEWAKGKCHFLPHFAMGQKESQGTGEAASAIHSPSAFDIPVKEPHQGVTNTQSRRELRRQSFHIRGRAEALPLPRNSPPLTLVENKGQYPLVTVEMAFSFVLFGNWREEAFKPLGPFVPEGV